MSEDAFFARKATTIATFAERELDERLNAILAARSQGTQGTSRMLFGESPNVRTPRDESRSRCHQFTEFTEVHLDGTSGRTVWRRIDAKTTPVLVDFVREVTVGTRARVTTDSNPGYNPLCDYLRHSVVNHSVEFVTEDGVHTNNAENVHKVVKTAIKKSNGGHYGSSHVPSKVGVALHTRCCSRVVGWQKKMTVLCSKRSVACEANSIQRLH